MSPLKQPQVRILIVDDHAIFRSGLRKLIESQPGLVVAGEASSAREALALVSELRPDLMLLDLSMPKESGLEVLRRVDEARIELRTVLLVAGIEKEQIIEALRLGARGVMLKNTASLMLYKCIRAVTMGEYWIDQECVSSLVSRIRTAPEHARETSHGTRFGLTGRELEILSAVTDGCSNREIADKFQISEQTVKHHLTSIYEKVGVSNRLELALIAINKKIGSQP